MATESSSPARPTRRQFLAMAGTGLGTILVPGLGAAPDPLAGGSAVARYASRPDLTPPTVAVGTALPSAAPGYVVLAPASGPGQHGPLLVDDAGEPVWFLPVATGVAHNLRVQSLAGRPVLTWWEGEVTNGYGQGEYVIADSSYRVLKRFSPANGYKGDLHEFTLTSRGTALVTIYNEVPADLSSVGGPASGTLLEGMLQEIDVRTNRLLLEWHSAEHVAVDESYRSFAGEPFDYFHINSIGVLSDGDLLVSARHVSAVYKLDRRSGAIVWRLGGKRSDFQLGPGATFAFQHDARGHTGNRITIFDDGAYSNASAIESASRAILLGLDTTAMTAQLLRADVSPHGLTTAMGSAQLLLDGGVFAGWGTVPACSEFSPDGALRFDAQLPGGGTSYRAFRAAWTGRPRELPAIAGSGNADGTFDLFASWNGATEVTQWRILGGSAATALQPQRVVRRTGFETAVRLPRAPAFVAAAALDATGRTLGTSRPLATAGL